MSADKSEKFKLTKQERNWVLYDVGNSAFTLLVSTLIPIFFNSLTAEAGMSDTKYLSIWNVALSISTIIVAVMGPALGAFSDRRGRKKKVFAATILLGAAGCMLMGFPSRWLAFLIIFLIARCAYQLSLVIYDSMLGDVTTDERSDDVSSQGYAFGYIGSVIPFIICLVLYLVHGRIGLSTNHAMAAGFVIVAVWWVVMSLPVLRTYEQKYFITEAESQKNLFTQLGSTLKDMYKDKRVFLFVVAFFFYIDGVYTIINTSTAYGKALGFSSTSLLLALLLTQFVAFPSALLFGRLARKYHAEILISVCIIAYFCIALFAVFMTKQIHFWILAVSVGCFQGGIQSLSRSYFTKIIPSEKSGQYFGFLDICGKGADALGSLVLATVTTATGNKRLGVAVIASFFIVGIILFRSSVRKGREAAR